MDRHGIRYVFEHKVLPELFFKHKKGFVLTVFQDKKVIFNIINSIFEKEGVDNPYTGEDFDAVLSKVSDDYLVLKITFPEPEEAPLCYWSFMIFDGSFEKYGFYCIEKGNDAGDDLPFVCSWKEEGTHCNHGQCSLDEKDALKRCFDLFFNNGYGSENDDETSEDHYSRTRKQPELKDEFKLLSSVNFREVYKKVLYVECRDVLEQMFPDELDDTITGIVAYCYIDTQEGLSLRPLMLAALVENGIQVFTFPHQDDTIYILRLRTGTMNMSETHYENRHMYIYGLDQETHTFFDVRVLNFPVEENSEFIDNINNTYDAAPSLEELRTDKYAFLDQFRHISYPDDVMALLYKEGNELEQVWVRLKFVIENEYYGELLNEPNQDFGCHKGTIIGLVLAKGKDAEHLVFTGRTATFSGEE